MGPPPIRRVPVVLHLGLCVWVRVGFECNQSAATIGVRLTMYRGPFITRSTVDRMKHETCRGPHDRLGAMKELAVSVYLDRRVRRSTLPQHRKRVGVRPPRAHHTLGPGSVIFNIRRRRR